MRVETKTVHIKGVGSGVAPIMRHVPASSHDAEITFTGVPLDVADFAVAQRFDRCAPHSQLDISLAVTYRYGRAPYIQYDKAVSLGL